MRLEEEENPSETSTTVSADQEEEIWNQRKEALIEGLSEKLMSGDLQKMIEAAKDIRKVVKKSSLKTRSKFGASGVIQPLVSMLLSPSIDAREASLLALLNIAVRNERLVFVFCFRVVKDCFFLMLCGDFGGFV